MASNPITSVGDLLTDQQLSEMTGIPRSTLAQWRHRGIGPAYSKLGQRVRYHRASVDQWLAENLVIPGADPA